MVTVNLDAPVLERPVLGTTADLPGNKGDAIALRLRSASSSFSGTMQLLSVQCRKAMRALHAFCREVEDIANGEASRALKHTLWAIGAAKLRGFMQGVRSMSSLAR
jgi:phytoene/squalene synthetase